MKENGEAVKTAISASREQKIEKIRSGKFFAKGDLIVFAACILLVGVFTFLAFGFGRSEKGNSFEVISYGETIATLPLGEDAEYLYTVGGGKGSLVRVMLGELYEDYTDGNLIKVEGGKVSVAEADCPDRICVLNGAVDSGEIICMPHGLTIKIVGGLEGDA